MEKILQTLEPLASRDRSSLNERMQSMGNKSLGFVEMCCSLAAQNPGLIPPYVNLQSFQQDMDSIHDLISLSGLAAQILEYLEEIRAGVGCNAFQHARNVYNTAKQAARQNIPGAKSVYDQLKYRYAARRKKTAAMVSQAEALPQVQ
jgi:hypothetical protein